MRPEPGLPGAALFEPPSTEVVLAEPVGPLPEGPNEQGERRPPRREPRLPDLAIVAHVVSLLGAFAFWAWLDRGLWFFGDEWDFLVNRGLAYAPTSHRSIWFPHNEHWSTLPVLLWRALFDVWHLSSYWPYLVPVLLAQVAIMHLTWRLCLRAGADPWVSAAAVALLGLLGAGAEDLAWAFQIGFVGSVLFGLVAIDLLDRPAGAGVPYPASGGDSVPRPATAGAGPLRPATAGASAALLASLMCSTLGDAMVVGAAVLAFARLPRRRALATIGPPVAIYAIWFATVGRLGLAEHSDRFPLGAFTNVPAYVWTGLSSALGQVFNLEAAGTAILVGLGAWTAYHLRGLWADQPALVALIAAVTAFYALAALGRDASTVSPTVSRYIYVAMALLVPVMTKVLTSLGPGRGARLGAVALLAFTAVGNVGQARTWTKARLALTSEVKTQLAATGRLLAGGVRDVSGPQAAPVAFSPNLSVADIARLERSHLVPARPISATDLVNARAELALGVWNGSVNTLTHTPLFRDRFAFIRAEFGVPTAASPGCLAFSPEAANQGMQVWVRIPSGGRSASLQLTASPAAPGTINYVAVTMVPDRPPAASVPVELTVPTIGTGYLNDNYAGADLVITWTEGTVLTLCGLAGGR